MLTAKQQRAELRRDFSTAYFILRDLPERTENMMKERKLSVRRAAQEIDIAPSTLNDFINEKRGCEIKTALLILDWLRNPFNNGESF